MEAQRENDVIASSLLQWVFSEMSMDFSLVLQRTETMCYCGFFKVNAHLIFSLL
jgi:hypothetical protein